MSVSLDLFNRLSRILAEHTNDAGVCSIKDILIREREPIRIVTPRGLVTADRPTNNIVGDAEEIVDASHLLPWEREDFCEFFEVAVPDWEENIAIGAVDRPISIGTARLRANLFTYDGPFDREDKHGSAGKLALAIRVFPRKIPSMREMGLPTQAAAMVDAQSGLILITGRSGAGKSTTAAAMIDRINTNRAGHIITIENPIELEHENKKCVISQREVGANVSSMARGVYDAMREFPIAILIGEIRNTESMEAGLFAGESGHLVIGTQHANSAVGCLAKITSYLPATGVTNADSISQSLRGVIAQTLVPTQDQSGWMPIFETIVINDDETRNFVVNRDWTELQNRLRKGAHDGLISMNHSLVQAVHDGRITEQIALQYSYDRPHLAQLLKK